jgi:hypothetical protein
VAQNPFTALSKEIELLKEQVASLFRLMGEQAKPRDTSIDAFCKRKGISRGTYLNMRKAGKGPRELAVGVRRIITPEAEADWDRERQAEAAAITEQRKSKHHDKE